MNAKDLLNNSTVKTLLAALRRAPATTTGSAVDLKGIGRKLLVILDAGNFGASATLKVTIQEDNTDGFTTPTDLYTFATLDAVATVVADMAPNERYIRAVAVGATETIDFSVEGIIYLERERPSGL